MTSIHIQYIVQCSMFALFENCRIFVLSKDCFKTRISLNYHLFVLLSCLGIFVLPLMNYLFLYQGPPEHHIQMTIDFMDISDNGYDACYHWLEVRYNLMGQDGPE